MGEMLELIWLDEITMPTIFEYILRYYIRRSEISFRYGYIICMMILIINKLFQQILCSYQ